MDRVSCRGETSALTLAISQLNSSAYKTLAMASLEGRGSAGVGGAQEWGAGTWGLRHGGRQPHLASTALSTVRGVKIFSRIVSWGGTWFLSGSRLATASRKLPED